MAFRDVLRRLRRERGLTQKQLSVSLGVSESTVSMYERGEREPNFEMLETIANFFSVDMNTLTDSPSAPLINDDAELTGYLEQLRSRPEQRLLFKTMKGATREEIEAIVRMYEAMQGRGKP